MDKRLFFSATQRNRDYIGDVLSRIIKKGSVLEIGSGSGEHGVVFQKRFPGIIWHTSESNYFFDNSLKMQNDLWGIKNLEEVCALGEENGFSQEDIIKMPANNFSVIYRKGS